MKTRRDHRRRRGASLIETALLLPVAVLLTLGGLDFSRIYVAGAQLEAAAATAASQAAREPEALEAARAAALANLPADTEPRISIEMVCACSTAPEQWGPCEQTRCGRGEARRYARAAASAGFATVGRYPGVPSESRLERQHFMRAD